jgi:hypothetical protein
MGMPSIEKRIIDLFDEYGIPQPSKSRLARIVDATATVQHLYYTTADYLPSEEYLSLVLMEFALLCAIVRPTLTPIS